MNINSFQIGGTTVLELKDKEFNEPDELINSVKNTIANGSVHILIDLSEVTYISSYALGNFVTIYRKLQKQNGQLKFLNVQPCVSTIFEMTRLNRIFEFYNDRDTALQSFEIQEKP